MLTSFLLWSTIFVNFISPPSFVYLIISENLVNLLWALLMKIFKCCDFDEDEQNIRTKQIKWHSIKKRKRNEQNCRKQEERIGGKHSLYFALIHCEYIYIYIHKS